MKQFDMIIHTFFLKDGTSRLFVYRNRKIIRGFPINFYQFKFKDADDAERNVDSIINDKNQLTEIVESSFNFYQALRDKCFKINSKQFGLSQKEIKKEFEKNKVKEKVYFLTVTKIAKDNIKANCHFARVVK